MRHPTRLLMALGIVAAVAGTGTAIARASGAASAIVRRPPSISVTGLAALATVNVATATAGDKSERILTDAKGLPLYTYNLDTATQSNVNGYLAQLWSPLVSYVPTEAGARGTLTVVTDFNGDQVQYNGHFLYTFVDDTPGHVTGQVHGFSVASPGLRVQSRRHALFSDG